MLYDDVWEPGRPLAAACPHGHPASTLECACGIYAARDPESALVYLTGRDEPGVVGRVLGRVALWGLVVEGEHGWRGEACLPVRARFGRGGAEVRCPPMSRDPEIEELRAQIAERDREIVSAINARLQLVRRLRAYKEEHGVNFLDIRQEQRIHRQLATFNKGPLSDKGLHELVGEILDLMKRELRGKVDPEA